VTLLLLSGRPGAGKTTYAEWLSDHRGFARIETDLRGDWIQRLCVEDLGQAQAARKAADGLGPNVVIEWGFFPSELASVRLLKLAGFDPWWFDGDEPAAREGYLKKRGSDANVVAACAAQLERILAAWPELEAFYGDHIIETVSPGPAHLPWEEVAALMDLVSRH
jgi:hypothetical protein